MKKPSRKILTYAITVIASLCCVCLVISVAVFSGNPLLTPTPLPNKKPDTLLTISEIIVLTSAAAQAQTAQALPPTPLPTATLPPPADIPTATTFISVIQTNAAQPTEYIYLTNTPFTLATQPNQPYEVCSCSGDTLNCSDFGTHASAQACFNYCMAQGAGDIHKLDQNNDGDACESLP